MTTSGVDLTRTGITHGSANLNALIARLHASIGPSSRHTVSSMHTATELAALQQLIGQATQSFTASRDHTVRECQTLHAHMATTFAQHQQVSVDEATISAELRRVDEYMQGATVRMDELARRLTGNNIPQQQHNQHSNTANGGGRVILTCLSSVTQVLHIVERKMQEIASSRKPLQDAELRSLAGIRTELTDLHQHVSQEMQRVVGLQSHLEVLHRQRKSLEHQGAEAEAAVRHASASRRAMDCLLGAANLLTNMTSLSQTVRALRTVTVELERVNHLTQAQATIDNTRLAELENIVQRWGRPG
ncbi:hypothetical protein BKA62DRAFT_770528 [Auriculariales sp. MPI-PUGE-AT-0066]|nr:hypothetical protein BKA62DRAFT_770528 [Auriculariales sp. MPI-PUGE-AT-0066]